MRADGFSAVLRTEMKTAIVRVAKLELSVYTDRGGYQAQSFEGTGTSIGWKNSGKIYRDISRVDFVLFSCLHFPFLPYL